ncbi:MAG: hypothetical protein QM820_36715 [Minicystis sp.]
MEEFQVDESRWPLVVVTYPAVIEMERYRRLFRQYASMSRRGDKIGYLIDMRSFNPLTAPAALRKAAAETFAENRKVLLEATLCEARVVENSLTSGILTAFDWLTGQKWPCANFTTMPDAERWVLGKLHAAGARQSAHA